MPCHVGVEGVLENVFWPFLGPVGKLSSLPEVYWQFTVYHTICLQLEKDGRGTCKGKHTRQNSIHTSICNITVHNRNGYDTYIKIKTINKCCHCVYI